MNQFKLHLKDKIIVMLTVGLILSWLLVDAQKYVVSNQLLINQANIDRIVNKFELNMRSESGMIQRVKQSVEQERLDTSSARLQKALNYVVNRTAYTYGLWIKPDVVINSSEYVSPQSLETEGDKAIGDDVYWGDIFLDQEKDTLNVPIFMKIQSGLNGKEAVLYRAVDNSEILRDLRKLSISKGGKGFLINRDRKIIQLQNNDAQTIKDMGRIIDKNLNGIFNAPFDVYTENYLVSSRPIAGSTWYFIYFQNLNKNWIAFISKLGVLGFSMILLAYFLWKDHQKISLVHQEALALKLRYDEKEKERAHDINPWLSREAEQILLLRKMEDAKWLVEFKLNSALRALSGEETEIRDVYLLDMIHLLNQYLKMIMSSVRVEVPNDAKQLALSESLVSEFINLAVVIGNINEIQHVICRVDKEEMNITFTFLSDDLSIIDQVTQNMPEIVFQRNVKNEFEKHVVGNKLIYHYGKAQETKEAMEIYKAGELPERVYMLMPSQDQNTVIRIYCERLDVEVVEIEQIERVPEKEILLIGIQTYSKIEEMTSLGIKLPKHIILYGDEYDSELMALAKHYGNIQRPYSLEKVEYALRFANKQKEKYNE